MPLWIHSSIVSMSRVIRDMETIEEWIDKRHRPRHPRHRGGARSRRSSAACAKVPGRDRGRHRCQGRQGGGRRLGRDLRADGRRSRAPFEDAGVAAIIYTDIERDGSAEGPRPGGDGASRPRDLASPSLPPAALHRSPTSRRCWRPECAILAGAITGRALYDGRIRPEGGARPHRVLAPIRAPQHLTAQLLRLAGRTKHPRLVFGHRAHRHHRGSHMSDMSNQRAERQSRRRSPGRVKCGRKQRLRFASTPWRWSPLRPASVSCLRCCCAAEAASRRLARRARGAAANGVCLGARAFQASSKSIGAVR